MGRPKKGSLSSYPAKMVKAIKTLREKYPGWGVQMIQIELTQTHGYAIKDLPSLSAIHRYLKQEGLVKATIPGNGPPTGSQTPKARRVHDVWEMDAQGAVQVGGIGCQALINIKDIKSKVHCMAFPVPVTSVHGQPKAVHYYWSVRLALLEWGLPKVIQVDKARVFWESTSKSPFPTLFHLWLVGLGIRLRFIEKPPPTENATVERSHQTMEKQVIQGQHYNCWKELFNFCHQRRKTLNELFPKRSLNNKAPLQVFPKAAHNARVYSLQSEEQLLDLKRIYSHLAKYIWYRKVSNNHTLNLGGHKYYVKKATPQSYVQIKFCNRRKKLIFKNEKEQVLAQLPLKKIDHLTLMGTDTKGLLSTFYKINHFRDFCL